MSWDVLYKNLFGRTPKRLPKEAFWQFSTDFGHIFVNLGFEWSLVRLTTKVLPQERQILTNQISILKKKICRTPPSSSTAPSPVIGLIYGKFESFWCFLLKQTKLQDTWRSPPILMAKNNPQRVYFTIQKVKVQLFFLKLTFKGPFSKKNVDLGLSDMTRYTSNACRGFNFVQTCKNLSLK